MDLKELLAAEELQIKKLNELVAEAVREEELISSKLLEVEQDQDITIGQKLADNIAEFGGSWTFIILFFSIIFSWILLARNTFDPYPFILLNLVLSCLAALQAPVIMMSQNRQEEKDRRRARNDYMVNLKAEIELRNLHGKIDLLIANEIKSLFDIQRTQLGILQKIENSLSESR